MKKTYIWELAESKLSRFGMSLEEAKSGFIVRKGNKSVRFTSLSDVLRIVEMFSDSEKPLDKEVENGYNNN